MNDALEARLPVSSLGLMAEVLALTALPTSGDGLTDRADEALRPRLDHRPSPPEDAPRREAAPEPADEPQSPPAARRPTDAAEPRRAAIRPLGSATSDIARPAMTSGGRDVSALGPQVSAPVMVLPSAAAQSGHAATARPAHAPGTIRPLTQAPNRTTNLGATASLAAPVVANTELDTDAGLNGTSLLEYSTLSSGSGNPGNPTVIISGSNVIGGSATATVMAPGGATIATVSWTISGAVEEQDYTNSEGKIVDFSNPKTVTVNGGSSTIGFYWSATPGGKTVTAEVTYAAPWTGGGGAFATLTVVAPTVNRLVLDSYPLVWIDNLGPDPFFPQAPVPGFTLQGQNPPVEWGFTLGASVTLPNTANQSGNYGFIQLASLDLTIKHAQAPPHLLSTDGLVLDNNPQFSGPTDHGWLAFGSWTSNRLNPGDTVAVQEWTQGSPKDTPVIAAPNANVMNNPDPPIEMELKTQFETWLVYMSSGGLWVGIGKVGPFTASGHQRFDVATNTWVEVAAPSPGGSGVIETGGPTGPQFVTWTGYMTSFDFDPPYPKPYFP